MIVSTTEPMAFGLLQAPGAYDVDIVAGEGQSFGNPLSYGGPHVGLLATKKKHVRQMPEETGWEELPMKTDGKGYVLTLATREQHIRREKATSNICTNHSLCALRSGIYLAAMGGSGLKEVSARNAWAAHTLAGKLLGLKGVEMAFSGPFL